MKFTYLVSKAVFLCASLASAFSLQATVSGPICTQTGFMRDGKNLTARLINPSGTVSGQVDATGCNIGIYYGPGSKGKIKLASIHDANYYGVVNDGANVEIQFSEIHDIGKNATSIDQGFGIYLTESSVATGSIHNNVLWNYGYIGIDVEGAGGSINIQNNIVTGQGPISTLDQVGIQLGDGTAGTIEGNLISGHSYTGRGGFGNGIYVFGGSCFGPEIPLSTGVVIQNNTLRANDVGIEVDNGDANCNPSTTPTNNVIKNNWVHYHLVTNVSGYQDTPPLAYQAGIENSGDGDTISGNTICGAGYTATTQNPDLFYMDLTRATNTTLTPLNKTSSTCQTVE